MSSSSNMGGMGMGGMGMGSGMMGGGITMGGGGMMSGMGMMGGGMGVPPCGHRQPMRTCQVFWLAEAFNLVL